MRRYERDPITEGKVVFTLKAICYVVIGPVNLRPVDAFNTRDDATSRDTAIDAQVARIVSDADPTRFRNEVTYADESFLNFCGHLSPRVTEPLDRIYIRACRGLGFLL